MVNNMVSGFWRLKLSSLTVTQLEGVVVKTPCAGIMYGLYGILIQKLHGFIEAVLTMAHMEYGRKMVP